MTRARAAIDSTATRCSGLRHEHGAHVAIRIFGASRLLSWARRQSPATETIRIHGDDPAWLEDSTVTALDGGARIEAPPVFRIGRFALLRRLGAGGMGVVYSAYDEDLDRRVAIKLLHGDGGADDTNRRRMRREAQALARLSHPNVVAVYEVGEHQGRLYLVMEHVQGHTLREWLAAARRSLPEILDVFRQAGEGLAAAHDAGLVHRDFKPANVLVADDGRARVLDFGLARRDASACSASLSASLSASSGAAALSSSGSASSTGLADELTQAGTVMGSPPYMSPEQFDGSRPVDARSDQFSFCVALWEAVFGQRPFSGKTYAALATAVHRGRIDPPPPGASAPAWLLEVLTRGLAVEPERRHPDMGTLLAALARRRRRRGLWALGLAGLAGVLGLGYALGASRAATPACGDGAERLEPLWGTARREAIHAALLGVDVPYAEATWSTAARAIDEFASAWRDVHLETCEVMTRPRGEVLADLQLACLEDRRRSFRAALDVIEHADLQTIDHVVRVASTLPSPRECADGEALLAEVRPPAPELAERVGQARDHLADAAATMAAGRLDDAERLARAALAEAEGIEYPPLTVEVRTRLGRILHAQGQLDAAEATLQQAYWQALRLGYDVVAVEAGIPLIHVVGDALHRHEEGLLWMRHAEALAERAGVEGIRRGWVLNNGGTVLMRAGRWDEARTSLVAALEIAEQAEPADPIALGSFLNNLGSLEMMAGRTDAAHGYLLRGLAVREAALGDTHPSLVGSLVNVGNLEVEQGNLDEAQRRFERALAVLEANGGRDHARIGAAYLGLDMVQASRGDYEGAYASTQEALAHLRKAHGPEHPDVGVAMFRLAESLRVLGRLDEAREQLEEGLALAEPALGRGHVQISVARQTLARIEATKGDHEAAAASFRAAAVDTEATMGAEHRFVGTAWLGAGLSLLELGRGVAALDALERARVILEATDSAEELAELRFGLARALRSTGGDEARALELARAARDALGPDADAAALRAQIDAWLAAPRPGGAKG